MARSSKLTNDFRDKLIQWLESRVNSASTARERIAYLEVIAFIKTEGVLK